MAILLCKTLAEIDKMEAIEVLQWRDWLQTEPRGWRRQDYLAASICHTISSSFLAFSGSKKQLPVNSFLIKFSKEDVDQDAITRKNLLILRSMFKSIPERVIRNLEKTDDN